MSKEDAKAKLTVKISRSDMDEYTDVIYNDIDDPALNGIDFHSQQLNVHGLPTVRADIAQLKEDVNNITEGGGGTGGGTGITVIIQDEEPVGDFTVGTVWISPIGFSSDGGSGGGASAVTYSATPPPNPIHGEIWIERTT